MPVRDRLDEVAEIDIPNAPQIRGLRFRPPDFPRDWAPIAALQNDANLADDVDEIHTPESYENNLSHFDGLEPARDMIVGEIDGRVVAYSFSAIELRDGVLAGETWGAVSPGLRSRGLGTALHRASVRRIAERLAADPRPNPRELHVFGMESESAWRHLIEGEGFVPMRYGFEMRRDLHAPITDAPLPSGIDVREVEESQHRAIFDADEEAFQDHWDHREATEKDFVARYEDPDLDTSLWQVAWDGEEVAGSVANYVFRAENERLGISRGWLGRVSVRRPWRGRGLARALVIRSLNLLRDRGLDEAWLGVDAANPSGAMRLYESTGFEVAKRWFAYGRPVDGPAPDGWKSAGTKIE